MVRIHAHECGQVKGNRESRLTLRKKVVKSLIGVFGGAKPAELAEGPKLPPIHGRVNAAGVRRLSGKPQVFFVIEFLQVGRRVKTFDRMSGDAGELPSPLRRFLKQGIESILLPLSLQLAPTVVGGRNLTHACLPHPLSG